MIITFFSPISVSYNTKTAPAAAINIPIPIPILLTPLPTAALAKICTGPEVVALAFPFALCEVVAIAVAWTLPAPALVVGTCPLGI
jgi:hypothetical protein